MRLRQTLLLSLGIIVVSTMISLSHPAPVSAIEWRDGKCQGSPREGAKFAIFLTAPRNGHTVDAQGEPTNGSKFCVELSNTATTATWQDLQIQSGGLIETRFANSRLRRETWHTGITSGQYQQSNMGTHYASDFLYPLSDQFNGSRVRYGFLGGLPISPQQYIYFIKIATSDDQVIPSSQTCANYSTAQTCVSDNQCFFWQGKGCFARSDTAIQCPELPQVNCSEALHCAWIDNACKPKPAGAGVEQVDTAAAVQQYIQDNYGVPDGYTGPLPPCAFSGTCRSVENLVDMAIKVVEYFFGIIAGLALAFFVYGGVLMIASFGNAEKFGKGKQVLIAATIGLAIAFSAYVIVGFVIDALGIQSSIIQL